jgi:hypothetical protein
VSRAERDWNPDNDKLNRADPVMAFSEYGVALLAAESVVDLTELLEIDKQGDAVIVRSTIGLAHNLGLTVVAEGVEDEATLEMLVKDGCDIAQGYFFSRPCPAEELTTWLTESPFGARGRVLPLMERNGDHGAAVGQRAPVLVEGDGTLRAVP